MDTCLCKKQEKECKRLEKIITKFDVEKKFFEKEKVIPRYLYIIMLSNNILMLISFLTSPILFYYENSPNYTYCKYCYNGYQLLSLIIFLILNIAQKFFVLENLNSNKCCIEHLKNMFKVNSINSKKLKKKFKNTISFYTLYLILIVLFKTYFIFLNIDNGVLGCSSYDIFGFIITRMVIFSSISGCLFNFLEYYFLNSLMVKITEKNLFFNFLSLFYCFGNCFRKKQEKNNELN